MKRLQRGGLYVLLFLLPFSKAAIEIVFPLLLIGWLAEHFPGRWRASLWRSPSARWVLIALGGYLAVCALSILVSTHPDLSVRGFIRKTLEYALLFVIAADVAKEPAVAKRCLLVLMASAWLVGLDGVAQEFLGKDPLRGHEVFKYGPINDPPYGYNRMTGPYESPIDLATYLMVVIPVVLVWAFDRQLKGSWAGWMLSVLLMGCLVRTGAKGAWLGLLGGLSVLFLRVPRWRRSLLFWGLGVVLAVGWIVHATERGFATFGVSAIGVSDRLAIWQAGWHMVQARPVLGHGLNTFMANYLDYWVGGEQQPRYAHNCFLQTAAETGLLGLTTFLLLLGAILWRWWQAVRVLENRDPVRAMVLGLSAGLIGFLLQSAFDTNFYALRQAVLFWTLAGLATGLALHATKPVSSGSS